MNTERYAIQKKLGQGGVGAVYLAMDTQLQRKVAVKRVLPDGGHEDQKSATSHLLKEANALSSLQHPNIVTIYDVGVDDDGPFVVMEYIEGKTLDAVIENAPLTWEDFKEVALQLQEALIAAQELHLLHRDLKPSNIMLRWLPSGKFQVKVVDFGLAKFSTKPSLQTIDQTDAVFGSIFFMAPEQFERTTLDSRTDMYALGCLYYFSLTGQYPFDGETAPQVMASHLQNTVVDLHEIRPDLPESACQWVMWHIQRAMDERPENARASLERFLLLNQTTAPVQLVSPMPQHSSLEPKRPRLLFANEASQATPKQPHPETRPQALTPPDAETSPHTKAQRIVASTQQLSPQQAPSTPVLLKRTSSSVSPPLQQQAPSLKTSSSPTTPSNTHLTTSSQENSTPTQIPDLEPPLPPKGMSPAIKWTLIGLLLLFILGLSPVLWTKYKEGKKTKMINKVVLRAELLNKKGELVEKGIPLTTEELQGLLQRATSKESDDSRNLILSILTFAKPVGNYSIDSALARYATTVSCDPQIRKKLFHDVISNRTGKESLPILFAYLKDKTHPSPDLIAAAIDAIGSIAQKSPDRATINDLIDLLVATDQPTVRSASERNVAAILAKSDNKQFISKLLISQFNTSVNPSTKLALLRLLGLAGTQESVTPITHALQSNETSLQVAALTALGKWPNSEQFNLLINFIQEHPEISSLRQNALRAALDFLKQTTKRDDASHAKLWELLQQELLTPGEKISFINALGLRGGSWAYPLLDSLYQDANETVQDRAGKAKDWIKRKIKQQSTQS